MYASRMAEDEVTDSWEELEDSGELDKRIQKLAPDTTTHKERPDDGVPGGVMEDGDRTAYQPQVRILKRQPNSSSDNDRKSQSRNVANKPTKTLAEREAAYAEARLRILGSAKDDENATENTNEEKPLRLTQQLEGVKVTENVLRQPKGPNGGRGFVNRQDSPR